MSSRLFLAAMLLCYGQLALAQKNTFSLKTNLLYDAATLTPNIGAELTTGRRTSVGLFYGLNPWHGNSESHRKLAHWSLMPEWRWWFCQPLSGHFVGIHALGGEYDVARVDLPFGLMTQLTDRQNAGSRIVDGITVAEPRGTRYEGWYVGGGLTYGYSYMLSNHWNLEGVVGLGYVYTRHDKYVPWDCGRHLGTCNHHYVGPTKLALNIAYTF